jgi:methylmalonyl-CoA mutase cobalamin-binding domain/chain
LSVLPPAAVARIAVENDVHAIGIPCVSPDSEPFVTELLTSLNGEHGQNIPVVAWVSVNAKDFSAAFKPGIENLRLFGPHTDDDDSASQILDAIE